MKNLALFLILFFQTLSLAFANGGPVDMSFFKKTGNIRLLQKADISLLKEDLRIKIISDTTFIEVTYWLKNNGNTQSVHYGFPVDMYDRDYFDPQGVLINGYDRINYFEAFVNGKPKKHSFWKQENAYKANMYKDDSSTENVPIHRFWHQVNLNFEKDSVQELVIKYAVENRKEDSGKGFYVHVGSRNFVYDLFPSSSWSDGIVQDFSVNLDVSDLKKNRYTYEITGLENLKVDDCDLGVYSLVTKNFNLKERSFISVKYRNYYKTRGNHLIKKLTKKARIKAIVSSVPNANYLIDNDLNTVWKGKEGDWIKITLPKVFTKKRQFKGERIKVVPLGIAFLNGDYSSKKNFETEGKIKEFTFKMNGMEVFNVYNRERIFLLPNSVFLPKELAFEGLVNSFDDHLGLYYTESIEGELPQDEKGEDKYIQTIFLKIKKSTHSNKEVAISDLYLFRETDRYLFSNGVLYLGN